MKPTLTTYVTKAHKRHRRRLLKTAVVMFLAVVGALVALNSGKAFAHENHKSLTLEQWDSAIESQEWVLKETCWHLIVEINKSLDFTLHLHAPKVSEYAIPMIEAYDKLCKRD